MASQLVIPPGHAQFAFKVVNNTVGHVCVWTIGAQLTGGGMTTVQGQNLFLKVSAALQPLWDNTITQTGFHALIGNDGPPMALDITGSVTGTLSSIQTLPPNVSYLLKKTTSFAGRAYRGRIFLPFVESGNTNEGGTLVGSHFTRLDIAATALFNVPTTGTDDGLSNWVLLHRAEGAETPPAPTSLTSIQASDKVATQRRRLER